VSGPLQKAVPTKANPQEKTRTLEKQGATAGARPARWLKKAAPSRRTPKGPPRKAAVTKTNLREKAHP
jgi:hypothetical protein